MRLDYKNADSHERARKHVRSVLAGIRDSMRRNASVYNRINPSTGEAISVGCSATDGELDVRLCASRDGELRFATGDVSFDNEHTPVCGATTLNIDSTDDEIASHAEYLLDEVVDGLAMLELEE